MARTTRFRRGPSPFSSLDNAMTTSTTSSSRQLLARRIVLLASLALTIFWSSTLFLSMHLPSPSLPTVTTTGRRRMDVSVSMGRVDFRRANSRAVADEASVSRRPHVNGQFPKSDSTPTRPPSQSQIKQSPSPQRDPRLVHVVETRFMQNQPHLLQLARARLRLFRTVCLPSVRRQTAWGDFLWIIRTDPALDREIRTELIEMLERSGSLVYTAEEEKEVEEEKENKFQQTTPSDNHDKHGVGITYLVGSNDNYISANATLSHVRPFDVRHMLRALTSHPPSLLAGKLSSLQELLDELADPSRPPHVVLWTRLDADDGLHGRYLEYLQSQAVRYFLPEYYPSFDARRGLVVLRNDTHATPYRPPKWTYWCAGTNVDWFLDPRRSRGAVYPVEHTNVCVTPGVTVAVADHVDPGTVPRLDHDVIVSYLRGKKEEGDDDEREAQTNKDRGSMCGREGRSVVERLATNEKKHPDDDDRDDDWTDDDTDEEDEPDDGTCFHMIRSFPFAAVRSRTPTSAGMLGISPTLTQLEMVRRHPAVTTLMWKVLEKEFRIEEGELVETNGYFGKMVFEIAEENAKGQCTEGHSCKTSSKDLLQQYVDLKKEMTGGFDIGRHGMIVDRSAGRMGYAQEERR